MSFEIGEPIEEGFDRLTERNGLLFVGLFVAIGLISSVFAADFVSTLIADAIESGDIDPADIDTSNNPLLGDDPTEPLFGLPIAVSLVGMAASLLAHASVAIAAFAPPSLAFASRRRTPRSRSIRSAPSASRWSCWAGISRSSRSRSHRRSAWRSRGSVRSASVRAGTWSLPG